MPRSCSRPSLIERGKRLSTRALALALTSGVIVGVTGAAGQSPAATAQRVSIQSAAFVRPTSSFTLPVSTSHMPARGLGGPHVPGDGISNPTVIVPRVGGPSIGGHVPQTFHPVGNGGSTGTGSTGTGSAGPGVPSGDPGHTGPTGDPGQTPATGPTGDPGHTGPTGDPGKTPPTGPTGDPGHGGPTGDPGHGGPTGDPGHGGPHHHRGDGGGNSGQTNPPVPVPVTTPVPVSSPTPTPPVTTPPVTHTTSQPPTPTPTTPVVSTPTPPPIKVPVAPPTDKGGGFSVTGLVPVASKPSPGNHSSDPLLSANGLGLTAPLSVAVADLTHITSQPGAASDTESAGLSSTPATQAAAARAAAAKAAAAKIAAQIAQANAGSGLSAASLVGPAIRFVKFIPGFVWLALAASLGLALLSAGSAVRSGRRARHQADRAAEVAAVALTDSLTGVLNRRGFIESAERELDRAGRHKRPFVLAYIDVRGLKGVNDGEGHLAGDRLLRVATTVLTDSVRAHDVVGRLGGDEFGLLLTEQSALDAEQVSERIAEQVAVSRTELDLAAHWDLTVGFAAFPEDGATVEDLLGVADRRLYEQRGIALSGRR